MNISYLMIFFGVIFLIKLVKNSIPPKYPSDDEVKKELFEQGIKSRSSGESINSSPFPTSTIGDLFWKEGWIFQNEKIKSKVKK